MNSLKHTMVLLLSGFLFALLLIEIGLRILGWVYTGNLWDEKKRAHGKETRILCLGDSFVYGVGAQRDKCFPRQLEILLGDGYKVINLGMGAQNSSGVVERLHQNIEAIRPDIIILLAGVANSWNYWGYQKYLCSNRRKSFSEADDHCSPGFDTTVPQESGFKANMIFSATRCQGGNWMHSYDEFLQRVYSLAYDQLYRVRIFKLVKLLYRNVNENKDNQRVRDRLVKCDKLKMENFYDCSDTEINNAIAEFKSAIALDPANMTNYQKLGLAYKALRTYDESIKYFKIAIEKNPRMARNYTELGLVYEEMGMHKESQHYLKQAIKIDPNEYVAYLILGHTYYRTNNIGKALSSYKKSIEINPDDDNGFIGLMTIYQESQNEIVRSNILAIFKEINGRMGYNNSKASQCMSILSPALENKDTRINQWIEDDMKHIIHMCKQRNIRPILLNYPENSGLNPLLRTIAETNSIDFVDNESVFKGLLLKSKREEYFSPDGHCNAWGYAVMAENIYKKLLVLGLVGNKTVGL